MSVNSVWRNVDGDQLVPCLEDAAQSLADTGGEVFLDFSEVHRLDPAGLRAIQQLTGQAARVTLRGVHVDVYKVLKLTRLPVHI